MSGTQTQFPVLPAGRAVRCANSVASTVDVAAPRVTTITRCALCRRSVAVPATRAGAAACPWGAHPSTGRYR